MENYLSPNLLHCISKVHARGKKCKLLESVFSDLENELEEIATYFKISDREAFFLAHVFLLNLDDSVDLKDLIDYLRCDFQEIISAGEILNNLTIKGILQRERALSSRSESSILKQNQYVIKKEILEAIFQNLPLPATGNEKSTDVLNVLESLYKLCQQKEDGDISMKELEKRTNSIIESNQQFPLIKKVARMNLQVTDTRLLFYTIWKIVNGASVINLEDFSHNLFNNATDRILYQRTFIDKTNELIIRNLVEIKDSNFTEDLKLKLAKASIDILKENGILLMANNRIKENVIDPLKIKHKELFFNLEERHQLDMLNSLLVDKNFIEMQNRLQTKNLPKGITVMFHGSSGTGKTESVYQIARKTCREIIRVDISNSKSMWFGESEKITKRIFSDYKEYSRNCTLMPILLFNEADAIISKRRDTTTSNVAQTENAIQNIILEELEIFEGIFIATTNLVNNIDPAFDRRFLFKIKFQKPDLDTKVRIWKSKMECLPTEDCKILALKFDFSGGQIDNIIRKIDIYELINGSSVDIGKIIGFCNEEMLVNKDWKRLGYIN